MDAQSVLVILAEQAGAEAALSHAAAAALPRTTIRVLHVRVDPMSTIMPTEEILSKKREEALLREGEIEAAALRPVYEAWAGGLPAGLVAEWLDVAGTEALRIGQYAKDAALLVMAAPEPASRGHALQAFHAALFDVRRPLLAVPSDHRAGPVRRILVGWKDGEASRRSIGDALPWLRQAANVQVVHVGEPDKGEPAAADQFLASRGIKAAARAVAEDGIAVGERLLAEAQAVRADWVVMGAYRHNQLMEWVLGGITRTILDQARLPIFLRH